MYQAVLANPRVSPKDKENALRQISQLQAHAAQTFGTDRAADMVQSSLQNNLAGSINNDPAQRDAALAFVRNNANNSAENIMRGVAQGRTEQEQGEAALRMKDTASVLAARGGELGKLFEGAAGSQFSMSRVSDRLGGMTDDQLTSLAREGASGRKLAQAARMLRSGDPEQAARAQQILQGALGGDAAGGDRARRLRREHQEQFEGIGGFFRGALNRAGIAYTQTEDEYVNEGLAAGTEADRVADEQTERVNAEEAAAREAGIGGDRDPMVQAAAELREAAQALNRVVQGGALDRAVAGE